MKRSVAATVIGLAFAVASSAALAQSSPVQCNAFMQMRAEAQKKAAAVHTALQKHVDRKEICGLVQGFYAAEGAILKFLEDNKTWCGIPDVAVTNAKASHEKTTKFRDVVCAEAPKPKAPTLSDAIGTPSLDTAKNTRTGPGTFDTLTGNPLAK
jgi:hypothetical protein